MLLPESAHLLVVDDRGNIGGDLVSLEVLRVVGGKAMASSVDKFPDLLVLLRVSLKHPFLLVTNPVIVLDEGKLLLLVSLVALRPLVGIKVVDVSVSRDRGRDVRLSSGRNEGSSAVIVAHQFDLSVLPSVT